MGGSFSWSYYKAELVHSISCSLTDSGVPPLSCSGSGSSFSGIATASYGSLSSHQAPSIKSKVPPSLSTSLSVLLQLNLSDQCRTQRCTLHLNSNLKVNKNKAKTNGKKNETNIFHFYYKYACQHSLILKTSRSKKVNF